MLELSEVESRRFGLRIARWYTSAELSATRLRDEVVNGGIDMLILRLSAAAGGSASAIRNSGLPALHTDTLVTFECPLQHVCVQPAHDALLDLREAQPQDIEAISALVRHVFARYPNHYTANPLIDKSLALAGYCEWAVSHIGRVDRLCWLSWHDGRVSGLACSSHDAVAGTAVGVLHGIHQDFGKRQIYTDLIRATQRHYQTLGYSALKISTQVGNLAVQRVWAREGFQISAVEHTWHVHPLFSQALAVQQQSFRINCADDLRVLLLKDAPVHATMTALHVAEGSLYPAQAALHCAQRALPECGHCDTLLAVGPHSEILGWSQFMY